MQNLNNWSAPVVQEWVSAEGSMLQALPSQELPPQVWDSAQWDASALLMAPRRRGASLDFRGTGGRSVRCELPRHVLTDGDRQVSRRMRLQRVLQAAPARCRRWIAATCVYCVLRPTLVSVSGTGGVCCKLPRHVFTGGARQVSGAACLHCALQAAPACCHRHRAEGGMCQLPMSGIGP